MRDSPPPWTSTSPTISSRSGTAPGELLDGLASPARVRAHTGTDAAYDAALWAAMAEQGWLGIEVPEDAGGVGLGTVEVAVLCEELGRHAAPAPVRADGARDRRVRRGPATTSGSSA